MAISADSLVQGDGWRLLVQHVHKSAGCGHKDVCRIERKLLVTQQETKEMKREEKSQDKMKSQEETHQNVDWTGDQNS